MNVNGWLKYLLYGVAWVVVASYIIYSATTVSRYHKELILSDIEVKIVDSTQRSTLVRERKVKEWVEQSGYVKIGEPASQVNLFALESVIVANGFIDGASAYITHEGVLKVDVEQREPLLRLRLDGYDSYITSDGFVFASPQGSAHYSMVVTGDYKPLFTAGYEGYIEETYREQLSKFDATIQDIEKEKYPLYQKQRELKGEWREFYRTGYISRGLFESREDYTLRLKAKQEDNAAKRRYLNYRGRVLTSNIEKIEQKRVNEIKKRNKFVEKYEDFKKLITFVKMVEKDRFWQSEIVQVVVGTSSYNQIDLRLVPRSSDHTILFGSLEREQAKLSKLESFYKDVLKHVGWSQYRVIDIQYENQVVCR